MEDTALSLLHYRSCWGKRDDEFQDRDGKRWRQSGTEKEIWGWAGGYTAPIKHHIRHQQSVHHLRGLSLPQQAMCSSSDSWRENRPFLPLFNCHNLKKVGMQKDCLENNKQEKPCISHIHCHSGEQLLTRLCRIKAAIIKISISTDSQKELNILE